MLRASRRCVRVGTWLVVGLALQGSYLALAAEKLKPEEVVARHLEALGPAAVRTVKTRTVNGELRLNVLTTGGGFIDGVTDVISEGRNLHIAFKFENPEYPGELLVFDGKDPEVANVRPGQRSLFGTFVLAQSQILSEGLMGGVLSTAWPLLDVPGRQPKLKYEGLKKIEGREFHQLRYSSRKGGDLDIRLFFDAENFRHVRTVYSLTVSTQIGLSETQSARQDVTRVTVEENFSEFQSIMGKNLPTRWTVRFTRETQTSFIWEWTARVVKITEDDPVEAALFKVKR